LFGYRYVFTGQFRFSESLTFENNLRKLLLTKVYNGRFTTIFCVTRRLLDGTSNGV